MDKRIELAADFFDRCQTRDGLSREVTLLADTLDTIGYDYDYSAMLDMFEGTQITFRETADGCYQSALIVLAWGQPNITFDTASGEVYGWCHWVHSAATIGAKARDNLNDFFRGIHDC